MKKTLLKLACALCCALGVNNVYSQQLAFPGAEGFGKYTIGGRTGSVYHVTNLNDTGTGSFRDAVSKSNRIVVFDVAGVIRINSRVSVSSNIYIAGQTAPGEGITIYGNGISFSGASNTICRYLRVRMGKVGTKDSDAIGIANGANMIFDHVSAAWGLDETFSISSDGKGTAPANITIQNSIIGQGLLAHSAGGLIQLDGGVTIYRTLYIDNDTRNPKFKGVNQYVNNIVYNWKSAAYIMGGDSEGTSYANAVGNYFITGPAGSTNAFSGANSRYNIYAEDNWVDKNKNGVLDGYLIPQSEYSGGPTFKNVPYDYPVLPTIPATSLYEDLVKSVGASLPYRDNLDWYLLSDLASFGEKGIYINNEADLPINAPTTWNVWTGTKPVDTDNDGIPDAWETANSLNPNNASDAMTIAANGYANIENYINSITEADSQPYLRAPVCLSVESKTQNEITIEWLGYTDREDGYIIEEKTGDAFVEVGRVGKGVWKHTFAGLTAESTHIYRVKAYAGSSSTAYTNELTVKTNPVPVEVLDVESFAPDRTWTGAASSVWDTSSANWVEGSFENGKSVLFNNAYTGDTEISLPASVDQSNMVVNANRDYTFGGQALSGAGSVNKAGSGVLTLKNDNNTYTGANVIHGGVVVINKLANGGQPSSIGASQNYAFNWVWKGGKISYTGGSVATDRNVALDAPTEFEVANASATITLNGVVGGTGDFIKSGPGAVKTTLDRNTYTGNTILRGGTYEMTGNNAPFELHGKLILDGGTFKTSGGADGMWGNYNFDVEVIGEAQSVFSPTRNSYVNSKFSGNGNLRIDLIYLREYYRGNWDNFTGNLTIHGPATSNNTFSLENGGKGDGIPNARINLTGIARLNCAKSQSTMYLGGLSGESTTRLVGADVKSTGAKMTWVVGGLGTDEEFKGIINDEAIGGQKGTTNIVKESDGYWRLTGANIYTGTTVINGGNLIVNGAHTGTGAVTVNANATLSGKGSLAAPVTVKEDGILNPGDLGIGTFTIKNSTKFEAGSNLSIDVNRQSKTNDKLTVNGTLTLAGNLNINLVDGSFANGDAITILSATTYSGSFVGITPSTPGQDLIWDTTNLYTSGILRVASGLGIGATEISETVKSKHGAIIIEGLSSPKTISVYNLSGLQVFNGKNTVSSCTIPASSGIYYVKIEQKTLKVIVQ
ncbi:autotransporter-associated beta strand repeat-containing protein [Viscerimonas tarda]